MAAGVADRLGAWKTLRSFWKMLRKSPENEVPIESVIKTISFILVWIIGLTSTIYLVGNALYLLFLAVVFGQNAPHTPVLEYLSFVAKNAIPAFCFAAIGIMGLRFWLSQRLWFLGLLALMVESALAIYIFVDSEGMLAFAE